MQRFFYYPEPEQGPCFALTSGLFNGLQFWFFNFGFLY